MHCSFIPVDRRVSARKCIKSIEIALRDSWLTLSVCPPGDLRLNPTRALFPAPPPTLLPTLCFHHSVKWSGLPTRLPILKAIWSACTNCHFVAVSQLQMSMRDTEFNAVQQRRGDFKAVTRLWSNSMVKVQSKNQTDTHMQWPPG